MICATGAVANGRHKNDCSVIELAEIKASALAPPISASPPSPSLLPKRPEVEPFVDDQPRMDLLQAGASRVLDGDDLVTVSRDSAMIHMDGDIRYAQMKANGLRVQAEAQYTAEVQTLVHTQRLAGVTGRPYRLGLATAPGASKIDWYSVFMFIMSTLGVFGCAFVVGYLFIELAGFSPMMGFVSGVLPAICLFFGTKQYFNRYEFQLSPLGRMMLFIGSVVATFVNIACVASQAYDPSGEGFSFGIPIQFTFFGLLLVDTVSLVGQAVLWADRKRATAIEKFDRNPAYDGTVGLALESAAAAGQSAVKLVEVQIVQTFLADREQQLSKAYLFGIQLMISQINAELESTRLQARNRMLRSRITSICCLIAVMFVPRLAVAEQPGSASLRELFVALSGNDPQKKEVIQAVKKIAQSSAPTSTLHVIDLDQLRVIASLQTPARWNVIQARKAGVMDAVKSLDAFVAAEIKAEASPRLDLPNLLRTIGSIRRLPDVPPEILVLANPLYNATDTWSFDPALTPSDQTIRDASTPFGVPAPALPRGTQLQVVTPTEFWSPWYNHRARVQRFWKLYCQEHQIRLQDFRADLHGAIRRLASREYPDVSSVDFVSSNFVGMVAETTEYRPGWPNRKQSEIPIRNVDPNQDSLAQNMVPASVPQNVRQLLNENPANESIIAINWWPLRVTDAAESLDIDIWANVTGRADDYEFLFFRSPGMRTSFGYITRDVRSSGNESDEVDLDRWEVMHLNGTDLTAYELYLNAFHADGPVRVRMVIRKGRDPIIDRQFDFQCAVGDQAQDHPNRHESASWLRINSSTMSPDRN